MYDQQPGSEKNTGSSEPALSGTERKLANLRPWKAGQSGNPSGKKPDAEIRSLLGKHCKRAMTRIVELMESEDERVALMAAKEVLDRVYGKTKPTDEEDSGGKSVTINIVRYTEPNGGNHTPQQLDAPVISIRPLAVS